MTKLAPRLGALIAKGQGLIFQVLCGGFSFLLKGGCEHSQNSLAIVCCQYRTVCFFFIESSILCQIDSSQCLAQLTPARVGIARSVHVQLGASTHVIRWDIVCLSPQSHTSVWESSLLSASFRGFFFFFGLFPIWGPVGASSFQSPRYPVLCFFYH